MALKWEEVSEFIKNDTRNRPVDKISRDLGIEPEQFINCFNRPLQFPII